MSSDYDHLKNPFSTQLPPLENPLILSHLFSVCPPHLLKSCRLVCHQWLRISLPIWRSSFPLNFKKDDNFEYVMSNGRPWKDPSIQEFLKYVENPEYEYHAKPHRHFSLSGWAFGRTQDKDRLLQRFWGAIGPGITKLELSICTFSDAVAFRKIIFQKFPNLRQLTLNNCVVQNYLYELAEPQMGDYLEEPVYEEHLQLRSLSIYRTTRSDECPVSFLELLGHFPWITSLEYISTAGKHPGDPCRSLGGLLKAIKDIREGDKRKLPLTNFNCLRRTMVEIVDNVDSHETLALLRELHIPLKSLKILVAPGMNDNATKGVFEIHKGTLSKLHIAQDIWKVLNGPRLASYSIPITVELSNLRELHVSEIPLEDMDFLQFTPGLEKLVISDVRTRVNRHNIWHIQLKAMMVSRTSKEKMGQVKLLRLKHFSLDYAAEDEDVQELVKWAPNLQILDMILDTMQLEVICEHLKHLEELTLKPGSSMLTDEMVCGRNSLQENRAIVEESICPPNMTNLQCLRTIQFGENNLTDISVFEGFLRLPKLTQIEGHVLFGQAAENALRDKMVRPFYNDSSLQ